MTAARVTMLGLASALVTTWLVAGAVSRRAADAPAPRRPAAPPAARSRATPEIEIHRDRLASRLERIPAPSRSPRNPFRFGTLLAPARARAVEAASSVEGFQPPEAVVAGREARAPVWRLVAIAEDRTEAGVVRVAALASGDEVTLVKVGDEVAGRYVVTAISVDVVELQDRTGGPPLRLALREDPQL
jgi:hypothetical protein